MNLDQGVKILIPLDGSAPSEAILPALAPLIGRARVETTLLRVVATPRESLDCEKELTRLSNSFEQGTVRFRHQIVLGRPVERILEAAARGPFDLVAMTTHGRCGLDRLTLGSVAEEVVRSSPIPVLLSKEGDRIGSWERIIVAVDGTSGSEEVLEDAVRIARQVDGEIHLLHVGLPLLLADGYHGTHFEFPHTHPNRHLRELVDRLEAQGVHALLQEREGIAAAEIPKLAAELRAGLICMTTEGKAETVPGLERSVTNEVIRKAPC